MSSSWYKAALDELGLITLVQSCTDTKLLCLLRFTRLFAYGGATLVLVSYLSLISISKTQIGVFMTLTLVGDTIISFFLTLFADALGRKKVLVAGSLLMVSSGVVFALCGNFWALLGAAVVGVISPSGNDIGPFRAVEESTLAQLTSASKRSDIFAWYTLLGTVGTAFGLVITGWVMEILKDHFHWTLLSTYRGVFWGYAVLGLVICFFTLLLSSSIEVGSSETMVRPIQDPETAPLLQEEISQEQFTDPKPSKSSPIIPAISPESRSIVLTLCVLFSLDSFGNGLSALSWVTYFFASKFSLSEGTLGTIFFSTSLMAAVSMLPATALAKRFGNVKTMVFTHLPSSLFLALMPFPNSLPLALTFLILRHCSASMDTAPRAAFVSSVLLPNERTAVMGLLNVVKTAAQCASPLVTGVLAARNGIGWSFVLAGICKVVYDLGILWAFVNQKRRDGDEENEEDEGDDSAQFRRSE